jgi:UDP-N-acetylglucosamine--N-acetylmuramyl-(pentapeptide) pyrophosphoryl-undecaprenol N-acetylglucosamine transferase
MIIAGGTGGHVYPGLAVAHALRDAGATPYWIGTERGLEARVVPSNGVQFESIPIRGLRGSSVLRWLAAPITVLLAALCAIRIIARIRPAAVLGMGGFVSGPGGVAAWLCRRPLLIHEQNAIPGLTNRLLSRLATRTLQAVPGAFPPGNKVYLTGNPVRKEISDLPPPARRMVARQYSRVLVFGGSGGAHRLNEIVPEALRATGLENLEIVHQCGRDDVQDTLSRYAEFDTAKPIQVTAYIEDMASAYANADLVIARAGALTVAEIAACGVASILIPYPYAVDDHQTKNARHLVRVEAAILVPESELTKEALAEHIVNLLGDRPRLLAMAESARQLAIANATSTVAEHCLDIIDA